MKVFPVKVVLLQRRVPAPSLDQMQVVIIILQGLTITKYVKHGIAKYQHSWQLGTWLNVASKIFYKQTDNRYYKIINCRRKVKLNNKL